MVPLPLVGLLKLLKPLGGSWRLLARGKPESPWPRGQKTLGLGPLVGEPLGRGLWPGRPLARGPWLGGPLAMEVGGRWNREILLILGALGGSGGAWPEKALWGPFEGPASNCLSLGGPLVSGALGSGGPWPGGPLARGPWLGGPWPENPWATKVFLGGCCIRVARQALGARGALGSGALGRQEKSRKPGKSAKSRN